MWYCECRPDPDDGIERAVCDHELERRASWLAWAKIAENKDLLARVTNFMEELCKDVVKQKENLN